MPARKSAGGVEITFRVNDQEARRNYEALKRDMSRPLLIPLRIEMQGARGANRAIELQTAQAEASINKLRTTWDQTRTSLERPVKVMVDTSAAEAALARLQQHNAALQTSSVPAAIARTFPAQPMPIVSTRAGISPTADFSPRPSPLLPVPSEITASRIPATRRRELEGQLGMLQRVQTNPRAGPEIGQEIGRIKATLATDAYARSAPQRRRIEQESARQVRLEERLDDAYERRLVSDELRRQHQVKALPGGRPPRPPETIFIPSGDAEPGRERQTRQRRQRGTFSYGGFTRLFAAGYVASEVSRLYSDEQEYQTRRTLAEGDPQSQAELDVHRYQELQRSWAGIGYLGSAIRGVAGGDFTSKMDVLRPLQQADWQRRYMAIQQQGLDLRKQYQQRGEMAGLSGYQSQLQGAKTEYERAQAQIDTVRKPLIEARLEQANKQRAEINAQAEGDLSRLESGPSLVSDESSRRRPTSMMQTIENRRTEGLQEIEKTYAESIAKINEQFKNADEDAKKVLDAATKDIKQQAARRAAALRSQTRHVEMLVSGVSEERAALTTLRSENREAERISEQEDRSDVTKALKARNLQVEQAAESDIKRSEFMERNEQRAVEVEQKGERWQKGFSRENRPIEAGFAGIATSTAADLIRAPLLQKPRALWQGIRRAQEFYEDVQAENQERGADMGSVNRATELQLQRKPMEAEIERLHRERDKILSGFPKEDTPLTRALYPQKAAAQRHFQLQESLLRQRYGDVEEIGLVGAGGDLRVSLLEGAGKPITASIEAIKSSGELRALSLEKQGRSKEASMVRQSTSLKMDTFRQDVFRKGYGEEVTPFRLGISDPGVERDIEESLSRAGKYSDPNYIQEGAKTGSGESESTLKEIVATLKEQTQQLIAALGEL